MSANNMPKEKTKNLADSWIFRFQIRKIKEIYSQFKEIANEIKSKQRKNSMAIRKKEDQQKAENILKQLRSKK